MNTSLSLPSDESRASLRMDARLDTTTRTKVDELAKRFHQPRAAVLCHIMEWGLSQGPTGALDQGESPGPVRHLHLYVPSDLHEQVEKAAAAAGLKTAPWLRHRVRQTAIEDFPASWQEATPTQRSHDSHTYTARFMLRLNRTSFLKLQELVNRFDVPKATIIRHLIAQATPEDFPKSWQMRETERHT
jgi:hypothetical protein